MAKIVRVNERHGPSLISQTALKVRPRQDYSMPAVDHSGTNKIDPGGDIRGMNPFPGGAPMAFIPIRQLPNDTPHFSYPATFRRLHNPKYFDNQLARDYLPTKPQISTLVTRLVAISKNRPLNNDVARIFKVPAHTVTHIRPPGHGGIKKSATSVAMPIPDTPVTIANPTPATTMIPTIGGEPVTQDPLQESDATRSSMLSNPVMIGIVLFAIWLFVKGR